MLIGEYTSKVGSKKRVAIPKKVRTELGTDIILTKGYENALVMVNKEMWSHIAKEVINGSFINKNVRDTSRFLVGSAVELSPDPQGRIVLPDSLYDYAEIQKELVFIGLVNWVELWDKQKWTERSEYIAKNSDSIASQLIQAVDDSK